MALGLASRPLFIHPHYSKTPQSMNRSSNSPLTQKVLHYGVPAAALLVIAGVTAGWSTQRQYKVGGAWIGGDASGPGWSALQIPMDSSNRSYAVRVSALARDAGSAALVAALGADTLSDAVGQARMINRDTAAWSMLAHAQTSALQIRGFFRYTGEWTYTSEDTAQLTYTLEVFSLAADSNLDGIPDPGATALFSFPGLTAFANRVPSP